MEGKNTDIVSEPVVAPSIMDSAYTIPRDGLLSMLSTVRIEDIPIAIKYLVDKLANIRKKETVDMSAHIWDNYQLSAEVVAMAPVKRKAIYGDYDSELTEILEEKYNCRYYPYTR